MRKQQLKERFNQFDTDGSGTLSPSEFLAVLRRHNDVYGDGLSIEDARDIIDSFDQNDDGQLSIEEFIEAMGLDDDEEENEDEEEVVEELDNDMDDEVFHEDETEEQFSEDEEEEHKVDRTRRKIRTESPAKDGPITKVKRKRLDSGIQSKKVSVKSRKTASKKKVNTRKASERKVKTRRVVTYSDKFEDDDS